MNDNVHLLTQLKYLAGVRQLDKTSVLVLRWQTNICHFDAKNYVMQNLFVVLR